MRSKVISEEVILDLEHGDLYVMSEKATGFDWKRSSFPTLRHCAGANCYIKLPDKHKPEGGRLDFALLTAKTKTGKNKQKEQVTECKHKTKAAEKEVSKKIYLKVVAKKEESEHENFFNNLVEQMKEVNKEAV